MHVILQAQDLCKYYGTDENRVKAVDHVDLEIRQGEFTAIVGKSGSGKSTLLHLLGGLDTPTSGCVRIRGKDISKMKE
ncbi:MAG: ATP-binding cassette domain-containing protein, partial [Eubacterium sp.]|nr:ATP-binding cassette domain-containing protein [Eubacterium sp.]